MNFSQLFKAVAHALDNLMTAWGIKLVMSAVVGALLSYHGRLLTIFVALVVIDLLTKWFQLSRQYLVDNEEEDLSAWAVLMAMRRARRAGYIKSDAMKHRFLGKIAVYMVFTFCAALLDGTFKTMGNPQFAVILTVGYLAVTEFLSILENLQAAGIKEAEKLHELLEKKGATKL